MKAPAKDSGFKFGGGKSSVVLAVLLVVFLLGTVALFATHTIKRGHANGYIATAAEQRLLSQRLATYSIEAASGKAQAFDELRQLRDEFDVLLRRLKEGDAAMGLPALPASLDPTLAEVEAGWAQYRGNINIILDGRESISTVSEFVNVINEFIPQLLALSDEVVNVFVRKGAPPDQIYIAARQLMLTQRIENNLNRVLAGGEGAATAADRFGRDAALFGRVLEGMIRGYPALNIQRVDDEEAREKLREVAMLFSSVSEHVGAILETSPQLFEVKDAAGQVEGQSGQLLGATTVLETQSAEYGDSLNWLFLAGIATGLAALLVLLLLAFTIYQDTRRRLAETTETNRRNQRAILRLLDEMTNLAEGDLTVHATVTEDITGAIADSVNYAIDALRSLVTTINETAVQVSTSAEKTQGTALRLADASNHQAREIASASAAITDMADSIEQVSRNAQISTEVAAKSVQIAGKGADTVRRSIDGMDTIREQIQETSKRIKRLGESSQEIGDIVSLINDIADQTNILALNAAIQAS
ncbi:MAG TPA: methyl-accepting chemotaxis protein, partial [Thioalkalivibrio sp.]|nr:methyl-accepting chemotaxis protein [Thioalkalivibrio sp.]